MSHSQTAPALGMTHTWDDTGILNVVFDRPGERVNLLTPDILVELGRLLDQARGHPDLRGLLITSAKPQMFIAGMDVERIAELGDAQQAVEAARFGQAVFQKIAALKQPSVCVIGGACLGGGTELALACSLRIAATGSAVRIGLPEVKLGIIPGFGGCQRLPRLVGLTAALDLILTGRTLDGRRARRIGLVDALAPEAYLAREGLKLLRRAISDGASKTVRSLRRKRPMTARLVDGVGFVRRYVLGQARKRTAARVNPRDYPAPFNR